MDICGNIPTSIIMKIDIGAEPVIIGSRSRSNGDTRQELKESNHGRS